MPLPLSLAAAALVPRNPSADDLADVAMIVQEFTFTETAGAGVYTATFALPAGAHLKNVIVEGVALWNAATSALLQVGDITTPTGYFAAVDLRATDLLAGESIDLNNAGGKAGADIAGSQINRRYSAAGKNINAIVTVVGGGGTTGRTRIVFIAACPRPVIAIAATKV